MNGHRYAQSLMETCEALAGTCRLHTELADELQAEHDCQDAAVLELHEQWKNRQ